MTPRVLAALLAAGALAALAAVTARADNALVGMGSSSFSPASLEVLEGDNVVWRNSSLREHDIRSDAAGFDSGRVSTGAGFSHVFNSAGTFAYACTIHDGMTGAVVVRQLLLRGPARPVPRGSRVEVEVRAPAGVSAAVIEADSGAGFVPVGSAKAPTEGGRGHPGSGGSLHATVVAGASATYRAVAGSRVSPAVRVEVSDAGEVRLSRAGRRLRVHAPGAAAGTRVVLQVHLRERFGWWPVARARLSGGSRVHFSLPARPRPLRIRVVLVGADWATVLAASQPVRVR